MKPRTGYIRKCARSLLKKHRINEPPVDLNKIIEREGLEYQEVDYFPDEVDAMIISLDGKTIAAVNGNHHLHRRRFSLAHEICHHLFHVDRSILDERCTIDTPDDAVFHAGKNPYEAEADIFAGELLVPLPFLKSVYRDGMLVPELSAIFQVSEQVASIAVSNHFSSLFK